MIQVLTSESRKPRLVELDFVKGIAITLMVFAHITFVGSWQGGFRAVVDVIYSCHMALFLFVSGYLFIPDKTSPKGGNFEVAPADWVALSLVRNHFRDYAICRNKAGF